MFIQNINKSILIMDEPALDFNKKEDCLTEHTLIVFVWMNKMIQVKTLLAWIWVQLKTWFWIIQWRVYFKCILIKFIGLTSQKSYKQIRLNIFRSKFELVHLILKLKF